jgi:hypothetical protein
MDDSGTLKKLHGAPRNDAEFRVDMVTIEV